jgi:hypothetical protein
MFLGCCPFFPSLQNIIFKNNFYFVQIYVCSTVATHNPVSSSSNEVQRSSRGRDGTPSTQQDACSHRQRNQVPRLVANKAPAATQVTGVQKNYQR